MKKQRIENLIKEIATRIENIRFTIERYKEEIEEIEIFEFRFEQFEIDLLQKLETGTFLKYGEYAKTLLQERQNELKKWETILTKLEIVKKLQIKSGGLN